MIGEQLFAELEFGEGETPSTRKLAVNGFGAAWEQFWSVQRELVYRRREEEALLLAFQLFMALQ
jgi:hypothetical protein